MFEFGHAFTMVARHLGDEGDALGVEDFPPVLADEARGLAVVAVAVGRRAPPDVVKHGGGFEDQAVVIIQTMQILQFVEEAQGKFRDVLDVMRLLLERLHEGEDFFAGGGNVH